MPKRKRKQNKKKSCGAYTTYISKIADRRVELGYTQQELSKRIGLERTSIANIEAGRQDINIRDIRKWMRVLKWDAETVLKAMGI